MWTLRPQPSKVLPKSRRPPPHRSTSRTKKQFLPLIPSSFKSVTSDLHLPSANPVPFSIPALIRFGSLPARAVLTFGGRMRLSRLRKDASLLAFGAELWSAAACSRFAASQLAGWTGHVPRRGTVSLAVDENHGKEAPKIRFRSRRGRNRSIPDKV